MRSAASPFLLFITTLLACHSGPAPEAPAAELSGTIRGVVIDAYADTPIHGAQVRLREGEISALSAGDGSFELRLVQVGTHRVIATAEGYLEGALANVVVEAGAETQVVVQLFQANPSLEMQHRWLDRNDRSAIPREEREQEHEAESETDPDIGSTTSALIAPPLPDMIRVWRSQGTALAPSASNGWADRSCEGDVVVLPFEEYVKGVIPHEWIPSWHPEALRAGAISARSYAASHAIGGGRWSCADVDDGTVTQVYRDDRAGPTDEAVDATRGVVVVRDGAVVRTEYSAENAHPTASDGIDDPVCSGAARNGHGRGVCQWGSQRWASSTCFDEPCDFGTHGMTPKNHTWIMEHYFPNAGVSDGRPPEPCAALGPEGGIVEDEAPCFTAFGPPRYWRTETEGSGGGLHWTNAFRSETPSNWAQWDINLSAPGEYTVAIHVLPDYAQFSAARYELQHAAERSEVIVDLSDADGWVELGTFAFAAGEDQHIALFDNYAEDVPSDSRIMADAVRLSRNNSPLDASVPPDAAIESDGGNGDTGRLADGGSDEPGDSGCGCTAGGATPNFAGAFVVAAWLFRRRPLVG